MDLRLTSDLMCWVCITGPEICESSQEKDVPNLQIRWHFFPQLDAVLVIIKVDLQPQLGLELSSPSNAIIK